MYAKIAADQLFKKLDSLEVGRLTVITPDGQTRTFSGRQEGESARIEFKDWRVIANMARKGDIGFAEDYKAGHWETDNLVGLTTLGLANRSALDSMIAGNKLSQAMAMVSYLFRLNTIRGSRRNIHAHYDLGNEFYKLWLDPTMTYSSGLYKSPNDTLEQAQNNKYDRMLDCLDKTRGNLLEIGCGWGGFAARAIKKGDYDIKCITLSQEQHEYAQKRLGSGAYVGLEDYRDQYGRYDHIVSIEMFEAVGERYWPIYFEKVASLLKKKGRAVIQTITMNETDFPSYRKGGDFIRSFIFPGGMLPSPSRFKEEALRAGLKCENEFFFGQDYARTLQAWLDAFDCNRDPIMGLGFDEEFMRLWRFYLAGCIAGFRTERTNVMQVELTHV